MSAIDGSGNRISINSPAPEAPPAPASNEPPGPKPLDFDTTFVAPSRPLIPAVQTSSADLIQFGQDRGFKSFRAQDAQYGAKTLDANDAAPATTPDPSKVQQAKDDYQNRVRAFTGGSEQATQVLLLLENHPSDPDYQAALLNLAKSPRSGPLDTLVAGDYGLFRKDDKGRFMYGSDSERQTVTDAIKAAVQEGTLTPAEIHNRSGGTPGDGWNNAAIAAGLTAPGGVTPEQEQSVSQVYSDVSAYKDASREAKTCDERLASNLAKLGPGLTDDQRKAFIQEFHAENAEAYEKQAKAAETLAKDVENNKDGLLAAASASPDDARLLFGALGTLANSPSAETALKVSGEIAQADPSSTLASAFSGMDFQKDVLEPGIRNVGGPLLLKEGGDGQSANVDLLKLLKPFNQAYHLDTAGNELGSAYQALNEASEGRYDKLAELSHHFRDSSPLARSIAGAAVLFGAADAVANGQDGKYAESLKGFAESGKAGLDLFAGAAKSMSDAGQLARYSGELAKMSTFAERMAPALGFIASSASIAARWSEIKPNDPTSIAQVLGMIGDISNAAGSVMEMFPATAPVGAVFSALGEAVSWGSDLLAGAISNLVHDNESRKCLAAGGITGSTQDAYMSMGGDRMGSLQSKDLLGAEQIKAFCDQHPDIAGTPGLNHALSLAAEHFGMTGADFMNFLDKMSQDGSGAQQQSLFQTLYNIADRWTSSGMTDPQGLQDYIDWQIQSNAPSAYAYAQAATQGT